MSWTLRPPVVHHYVFIQVALRSVALSPKFSVDSSFSASKFIFTSQEETKWRAMMEN